MLVLIRYPVVLTAVLLLTGCMAQQLANNMLEYTTKSNVSSCKAGYREACIKLFESGCKAGATLSACRFTNASQSELSTMLNEKCGYGDKGACYTLISIACKKGDISACVKMNETGTAILFNACTGGDQLACKEPPPGVKDKPVSVIIGNP